MDAIYLSSADVSCVGHTQTFFQGPRTVNPQTCSSSQTIPPHKKGNQTLFYLPETLFCPPGRPPLTVVYRTTLCLCLNPSLLGHGLHLSKTQKSHLSILQNQKNGIPPKVNSTATFVSQKCLHFVLFCPQVRGGKE